MAPNFFSKLVKGSSSRDGTRSPSPSTSPTYSNPRTPTISVSRPSTTHKLSNSMSSSANTEHQSDHERDDNSSINPNVTVIPPSPRTSQMSVSDGSSNRNSAHRSFEDLRGLNHKPSRERRVLAISLDGHAQSPVSPVLSEDVTTPTPQRPMLSERDNTMRPLSNSSSAGDLRGKAKASEASLPRSAVPATSNQFRIDQEEAQLQRSNSSKSNKSSRSTKSSKSSRAGLTLKMMKPSSSRPPENSGHERSASVPTTASSNLLVKEDGEVMMSPIVESPTNISPSYSAGTHLASPAGYGLATSATVPNIPSSSLLAAPDNSDTVSVYSVTTGKKRRLFRRLSVSKEPHTPVTPGLPSSNSANTKSPKRKNTGLAAALATTGLAMANSTVLTPQVTPAEVLAREARSNSLSSNGHGHRTRTSIDKTRSPPRSRHGSLNYAASDVSDSQSFMSGIGGDSDDDDELDLDADDIPVTGFAVASARRNQEFHEMFPGVPEGDYLIEDYGCALQREILIQGRLYISENHVCFHANIFGWVTDLTIPMYDVTALDKRMTAFVIPNAIQITSRGTKYTFTSFLSRDTTFDVIYNVWRLARPEDSSIGSQLESPRASVDAPHENTANGGLPNGKTKALTTNKITRCACGKAGQHYNEQAMDITIPGTPEKIYNLMFTSGFIKDFMRDDQKLQDIQISDWIPLPDNGALLARNMSYIKPLNGSIGPKSTKCELRDECAHCDFDEYVSMITTTRTPDVPSGGVFSVKTRTCITWASSVSSRIVVTTQVEWTGRSFIKGIIEKSCIDGQKTYQQDLEKAMRDYIHQHMSEFVPEGVDPAVVEETEAAAAAAAHTLEGANGGSPEEKLTEEEARASREKERNARGLQWAYDTFEGAMKVAKQSTEGAVELLKDAWDQSSTSTMQYFVIVLLVISNVWTLTMMGGREEAGRRKEIRRTEEREKWVKGVVTALWEELTTKPVAGWPPVRAQGGDVKEEIAELTNILDKIEERVNVLRKSLGELD
ncbi:hypothetical protein BDY19DRAFT_902058 [Irpex rosettiformis]|uniref:Uncharacterized protein n=1 Tax=Irpex rosettiformis TaxID=378272 RepID=A0ACB8UKP5_9APHY|nr:hypothetical protein BDY19DRAFT_902058 [Irpex rosettiformis]